MRTRRPPVASRARHAAPLRRTAAALAILALLLAGRVFAEAVTTPRAGDATRPIGASLDDARRDAIDAACRNAVERAAVAIAGESAEKIAPALDREIVRRWRRYVQGCDVLEQRREGANLRVRVRALVYMDRLRADVAALTGHAAATDAVLVLSVGTDGGRAVQRAKFAEALAGELAAANREVLSADARAEAVRDLDLEKVVLGETARVADAARAGGGRFAVVTRDLERDARGCLTRVALDVLKDDEKEPLLSKTYRVRPVADDCASGETKVAASVAKIAVEALERAVAMSKPEPEPAPKAPPAPTPAPATPPQAEPSSAPPPVAATPAAPPATPAAPGEILVLATNMGRFNDLTSFQRLVAGQTGVKGVHLIQVEAGAQALYGVAFEGTPERLAALLTLKRFADLVLAAPRVEDGRIVVEVGHAAAVETPKP